MSESYEKYRQLLDQGCFTEAVQEAETAYLRGRADDPFWLTRQAVALARQGRHDRALEIAGQAFALAPDDPYCLLAMAEAHAAKQNMQEASLFYEEASRTPKIQAYARKRLLHCLMVLKAYDRFQLLLAGWELEPFDRLAWQARLAQAQGRRDEAVEACHRLLKLRPDDRDTLWRLTELEIEMQGLDAVLTRMARIAKIPSRPPVYKEIYASLCRRAGKSQAALAQYEELNRTGSDPRIQRKEAFVLAKSGREMEAIGIMEELLRQQPADMYVNNAYRAACRRVGQLARARAFYQGLLKLHPQQKSLFGRLHQIKKELEEKQP